MSAVTDEDNRRASLYFKCVDGSQIVMYLFFSSKSIAVSHYAASGSQDDTFTVGQLSLSHYVRTTQYVTNATLSKSSTSHNFWLLFGGAGAYAGSYQVAVDVGSKTVTFTRDGVVLFVLRGAQFSLSRIELSDGLSIRFNVDTYTQYGALELWAYFDSSKQTGAVLSFGFGQIVTYRIEGGKTIQGIVIHQLSLSQIEVSDGHKVSFGTFTDSTGLALIFSIDGMQLQVKQNGLYYVDATGVPTAIWGIYPQQLSLSQKVDILGVESALVSATPSAGQGVIINVRSALGVRLLVASDNYIGLYDPSNKRWLGQLSWV